VRRWGLVRDSGVLARVGEGMKRQRVCSKQTPAKVRENAEKRKLREKNVGNAQIQLENDRACNRGGGGGGLKNGSKRR